MPNDAKLGLVVGIGLVITVAVLFYRKELPAQGSEPPAHTVGTASPLTDNKRAALPALPTPDTLRRHLVREGETLTHLAKQYYGDAERRDLIRQANRPLLGTAAEPRAGTLLVIPEVAVPFPDPQNDF